MGDLLRSEPMELVQLFIQVEAAHATVQELGKLGIVEFKDLNPHQSPFQRTFVSDVKRCDELERKFRFVSDLISRSDLDSDMFIDISYQPRDQDLQISEIEAKLEELEAEYAQMSNSLELLNRNHNELLELKVVIEKSVGFFGQATSHVQEPEPPSFELPSDARPLIEIGTGARAGLGFLAGTIPRAQFLNFERVVWRATRGNIYMKYSEVGRVLRDPSSGVELRKNVFVIFYQGEFVKSKISKICESFGANLYPVPDTQSSRRQLLDQTRVRLEDLDTVLDKSLQMRRRSMLEIRPQLEEWRKRILNEKATYHTLNLFNYDIGRKCLIGQAWCPRLAIEDVQVALRCATVKSGALVPSILTVINTTEQRPTYFRTNKFTQVFQDIISAYGVPSYQEINPTVFTIITFPFLFAVMFGDVGHAIIMLLFSWWLVRNEVVFASSQKLSENVRTAFDGRYLLLLMGAFSLFTGFLYNECFSIPMNLFGSNWRYESGSKSPHRISRIPYVFGVDPAWRGASNELSFYNSLKMKLSIVLGVAQMLLGIILSAYNARFFQRPYDFWFEFVPRLIFMTSLFGYLVVLIFLKWGMDYSNQSSLAPSLLLSFINMALSPTSFAKPEDQLYPGQLGIQQFLLFIAIISVPWMLLPKPLLLRRDHYRRLANEDRPAYLPVSLNDDAADRGRTYALDEEDDHPHGGAHEEFDFSELLVHQVIHTIEFVLGAVSNTASYLRLWALSLAHAQLSAVFWEQIMLRCFEFGTWPALFVGFALWAALTFGVLMLMESLSAFLHALRLHWVEFLNKFYEGTGKVFEPFSFSRLNKVPKGRNSLA